MRRRRRGAPSRENFKRRADEASVLLLEGWLVTTSAMKAVFSMVAGVFFVLGLGACDRHSWEDDPEGNFKGTKRLFAVHHGEGHHGDEHGEHKNDHGAAHPEKGEHKGEKH